MSNHQKILHMGIAGAGGFARFAAASFFKNPRLKISHIMDKDKFQADVLAKDLKATAHYEYESFLDTDELALIYIATPPFLHYEQSKKALLAGKHVICEKPAALHVHQAEELALLAKERNLLYTVNLMQRYNPLFEIIKDIIEKNLLGNFLHGFFENYAASENLGFGHWFWDIKKSGGIFIEHGIHFFDLFSGWLGKGEVIQAIGMHALGDHGSITDRVQAVVQYKLGFVNFFHGFNQLKVLDRQEMRLQFELGDISLYGWIPTKLKLTGLLDEKQENEFNAMMKNYIPVSYEKYNPGSSSSNQNQFQQGGQKIEAVYNDKLDKQQRYGEMLKNMMEDQLEWVRDHTHKRRIDQENAVQSLVTAEQASLICRTP
jgi:predicted dehydrogenase